MGDLKEMFDDLKRETDKDKTQILTALLHALKSNRLSVDPDNRAAIADFLFEEMTRLIDRIPQAGTYREKDRLFDYHDQLMGLFAFLRACKYPMEPFEVELVKTVCGICDRERVLETALDEAMERQTVERDDIAKPLTVARSLTDEYQRGRLYCGLNHYARDLEKLTELAKDEVATYIGEELERYLAKPSLTEDEMFNMELAADICRYFITDTIVALLERLLSFEHNNVRLYALISYVTTGHTPQEPQVRPLAEDLVYADLAYGVLAEHGMGDLFPREYRDPEYLAKSHMVNWLTYPTELGKAPDAIELLGCVAVKKQPYYIFKFRSDSDTLAEENKNQWLVGWASNDGGTFSHFDPLSQFEKKTVEKTLKAIRKKFLR